MLHFGLFFNEETDELLESIKQGKVEYPETFWKELSEAAKDFVSQLLKVNPQERYSAIDALRHRWVKPEYKSMEAALSAIPESLSPHKTIPISTSDPSLTPRGDDSSEDEEEADQENNNPDSHDKVLLSCVIINKTRTMYNEIRRGATERNRPSFTDINLDAEFAPSGVSELDKLSSVFTEDTDAPQTEPESGNIVEIAPQVYVNENSHPARENPPEDKPKRLRKSKRIKHHQHHESEPNGSPLKIQTHHHYWKKATGQWCSICDDFIFGLTKKPGFRCKDCRVVVHNHCLASVTKYCYSRTEKISTGKHTCKYLSDILLD